MRVDLDNDPVTEIARRLLGATLSTWVDGEFVAVRLTETEAYAGADDPASHAFRGPSARTASMFESSGRLYVYRHMGLHQCMNLVCAPAGRAAAVLLRSGEVTAGAQVALGRRTARGVCRTDRDLARGPGRLTVALGITRELFDGQPVHPGQADAKHPVGLVWAEPPVPSSAIASSARIGVPAAGADPERFGWRYWIAGDSHVSARTRS